MFRKEKNASTRNFMVAVVKKK